MKKIFSSVVLTVLFINSSFSDGLNLSQAERKDEPLKKFTNREKMPELSNVPQKQSTKLIIVPVPDLENEVRSNGNALRDLINKNKTVE